MSQSDKGPPVPKQQYSSSTTVPSISIKVINPDKKRESILFVLRHVGLRSIEMPENMSLLTEKLGQDLVAKEPGFEMGYFRSNKLCGSEIKMM